MAATWGSGACSRELAELPGLLRLRYTTSHPRDMDDELIAAHRDVPTLMPFLHLPVQSGSDRVLAAMNRKHTAADYLRLVERLRAARPDLALSSDFIVGHPGETEADFEATLALVREVGFAQAYSFKYSPRPGTPAAGAPARCPRPRRTARLQALQALLREQQAAFNAGCVGLICPCCSPVRAAIPARSRGGHRSFSPSMSPGRQDLIGDEIPRADRGRAPQFLVGNPSTRRRRLRLTQPRSAHRHPLPLRRGSGGKAVTLQFSDNTLLPLLLGDHDRHLVRIEQALGVRLSCRGNRVAIAGEAARVDAAQAALQGLWRRLERGESVGRPEVEAAIRLADMEADPRLPLSDLPAIRTRRGAVGPRSPGQAAYIEALASHEMVFGIGPAGTGKTYLAVAQAVAMLQAGKVDRIVLSRPAVEAGERLGFLPGDMKEKVDPYLRPLYDALHDMMPAEQVIRRLANGEIEVAPLAFMRGRTLAHCLRHSGRGAEHHAGADEDVADPDGRGDAHGGDRRSDARWICRPGSARACATRSILWKASRASASSGSSRRDVVRHPLVARIVDAYDQRAAAEGDKRREARRARRGRRARETVG